MLRLPRRGTARLERHLPSLLDRLLASRPLETLPRQVNQPRELGVARKLRMAKPARNIPRRRHHRRRLLIIRQVRELPNELPEALVDPLLTDLVDLRPQHP